MRSRNLLKSEGHERVGGSIERVGIDRVFLLLSLQRALWGQVTSSLRGVAVALRSEDPGQKVEARFLYEGSAGEVERECTSMAETSCIADMPAAVEVAFSVVEHSSLDLLPGEEWVYLRYEAEQA
jgi:hypothetical protein